LADVLERLRQGNAISYFFSFCVAASTALSETRFEAAFLFCNAVCGKKHFRMIKGAFHFILFSVSDTLPEDTPR